MTTSKKVTELTAMTAATADDLLMVVDSPAGTPTSMKITVKSFLESNATSNVAVNGSGNFTNYVLANTFISSYTSTPANSTAVPAGFAVGASWSDGSYIYWVTGASALKRVAISSW